MAVPTETDLIRNVSSTSTPILKASLLSPLPDIVNFWTPPPPKSVLLANEGVKENVFESKHFVALDSGVSSDFEIGGLSLKIQGGRKQNLHKSSRDAI